MEILWTADYPSKDELTLLAPLKLYDTLLLKRIYAFSSINLLFIPNIDIKITGGYSPIIQHIPNLSKSDLTSLRAKHLLFLDQVSSEDDLSFYTDGSLFQEGPRKSIMSFAWIETTMSSPIPFQGATMFQPSSTTAETFAVLTVLMSDPSALKTATFNYLGPLYGNMRKWSKSACHAYTAASSLHNKPQHHLLHLMASHPVDWSSTSRWLRKNNDNGSLTAAQYLGSLITSFPDAPPSTRDVTQSIERLPLFSHVTDTNHPTYLLLHQLVPEELVSLINLHIRSQKATMEIVELFIQYFYTQITRKFWRIHSNSFHSWEKVR
ncbi:hypothetical protein GLOIN_2v1780593 [Rhizophagus clarus]|uniref:Uncharacterized protein n=1 Tax=Rhizophagus clarus TaxID=94130 RepID=A0A8H3LCP4_9GLOM|nr:hypothetical protein GLOIN_2v1780593 [Rhizophagus clarus]